MTNLATVIKFNQDDKIQRVYKSFMDSRRSDRTREEYKARIDEFFAMVLKDRYRGIDFLRFEDIETIEKNDVINEFITPLKQRGNTDNTIIVKLNSVRSFYNELLSNNIKVNPLIFKHNLKKKPNHHIALSHDEVLQLIEFMKKEKDGLEKYLLTKMFFHTANRKTATVHMTWDDIQRKRDISTGQNVWVVLVEDKGEKVTGKPISDDFYKELCQLKRDDTNRLFPTLSSSNGAYKRFERSLKKFGKVIGKNITIHGLKATAITIAYQMSKDIELCRQLGGHADISTTGIYIREEEDYTKQMSYIMSKKVDESILDNMSGDELKEFINKHDDIKRMIIMRLNL
jgi:integrase